MLLFLPKILLLDVLLFLFQTHTPSLSITPSGMSEMVKERPPNPIEYLASYLLQHDPQRITDTTVPMGVGTGNTTVSAIPSSQPPPGSR
jgi:Dpy-30 motif